MKKTFIYIIAILLLVVITVSGTYAYYVSITSSNNNAVTTDSSELKIIYTGDNAITGDLNLVNSKEEGHKATVKIALSNDSVDGKADMYIKVDSIGQDLASNAFIWETYRTYNGTEIFVSSGTFEGASSGDKIYIDTNYILSTQETSYTVYIWLNGNRIGNEVLGESFEGYIGAEVKHITDIR